MKQMKHFLQENTCNFLILVQKTDTHSSLFSRPMAQIQYKTEFMSSAIDAFEESQQPIKMSL